MYKIVKKRVLNEQVKLMEIEAPLIAKKAQPGQFIIFRINETGERVPLTIAGYDREKGIVTIIFQEVGATTKELGSLNEGDALLDFVGPLGMPTELDGYKKIAVIGGGLGTAIAYPQAKALFEMGSTVHGICGFRNEDLIILKEEMQAVTSELFILTDDGSYGNQGFVTTALKNQTRSAMKAHPESKLWQFAPTLDSVNGKTAFDALRAGDEVGKGVVAEYIRYLSIGVLDIINLLFPEAIIFGGGISKEGENLLAPLREIIKKECYSTYGKQTELLIAELGNDAGIIGAAFFGV